MNWTARQAELQAAQAMQLMGFTDAQATAVGPDYGIDVVSIRALAQVKYWDRPVGRPQLNQLRGAQMPHQQHLQLLFFARAGYTREAVAYADQVGMALFTLTVDDLVAPVNTVASRLCHRPISMRPATSTTAPTFGLTSTSGWDRTNSTWWWIAGVLLLPLAVMYFGCRWLFRYGSVPGNGLSAFYIGFGVVWLGVWIGIAQGLFRDDLTETVQMPGYAITLMIGVIGSLSSWANAARLRYLRDDSSNGQD